MKPLVYRAAQLRGWALLGLLIMILAVLVGMIRRNLDRFEYAGHQARIPRHGTASTSPTTGGHADDHAHREPPAPGQDFPDALGQRLETPQAPLGDLVPHRVAGPKPPGAWHGERAALRLLKIQALAPYDRPESARGGYCRRF